MQLDEYNALEFVEVRFLNDPRSNSEYTINYQIDNEYLTSFQINFSNETMKKTGSLMIEDGAMLNALIQFRDTIVEITYLDIFNVKSKLTFQITGVHQFQGSVDAKGYEIELQDYQSYCLENSFLGKSYKSGNMTDVITDFLEELGIFGYPVLGDLEFSKPLVIPKHINNLKFFEDEIYRMGQSIQGIRNGIRIFKTEELQFESLPIDDQFVEKGSDKHYKNRIQDFDIRELMRDTEPKFISMDFDDQNAQFYLDDNFDITNFQIHEKNGTDVILDTVGRKPVIQRITKHNEMVRRHSMRHNQIDIVVNGYCYREVNVIQPVELAGNTQDVRLRDWGNVVNSGAYVIVQIQDRYVQGSLFQKLYLRRANTFKTIKPSEM